MSELKAIALMLFGAYMGYVTGTGHAWGQLEALAKERPAIHGDVTIVANRQPVNLSNIDIKGDGKGTTVRIYECAPGGGE